MAPIDWGGSGSASGGGRRPVQAAVTVGAVGRRGAGGRSSRTTGRPSSRAATSLAAAAPPPLSRATSTSIRCPAQQRPLARPPRTGPGRSSTVQRAGSGGGGGSTARSRNHRSSAGEGGQVAAAGGQEHPLPQLRQQRARPRAASGTRCQRSPGPAVQPGRRSASSGSRSRPAAAAACRLIRAANGWVASTSTSMPCARSQPTSPSTPPKPPIRSSPAGTRRLGDPAGQRGGHRVTGPVGQLGGQPSGLGGAAQDQHPTGHSGSRRRSR